MKNNVISFLLFFLSLNLTAQICSIESMEICAGQEVLLPVYGKSLPSVGALTLFIGYDTINLSFQSIENINPQLIGLSVNLMLNPTQLAFAWSNTEPVSLLDEKLFDIKFTANGNSSFVNYNTGCELSDTDGVVIPVTYLSGGIISGIPVIGLNPHDTTIFEGGTGRFSIMASNALNYSWRESQDNGISWITLDDNEIYSGTQTNILTISAVPYSFNNYLYQCFAIHNLCQTISGSAKLSVDQFSGSSDNHNSNVSGLVVEPQPFHDNTKIGFYLPCTSNIQILVRNCIGKLVVEENYPSLEEGYHYINIQTSDWNSGIYLLHLVQVLPESRSDKILKIIRN